MNRKDFNLLILERLTRAVNDEPDSRFSQILRNLAVIEEVKNGLGTPQYWKNEFNLESEALLDRMVLEAKRKP